MAEKLIVLLGAGGPELAAQARAVSPQVETVTREQVEADPELLAAVEVAYSGLGREQLRRATALRWYQTGGAGVNGLLTPELIAGDLVVTNASGIHAEPIAEHMFGMLLMRTRRLAEAWDQQKTASWKGYDFHTNLDFLPGKTLGILGAGRIGIQTARVGRAFGMRVVGMRRSGEPLQGFERMYSPDQKEAFLGACDVVMNILPLTDKTRGFFGRAELAMMKPGAILVNAGRGATVDTAALIEALGSGHLGAALLDVTDPEPLPDGHPLWAAPNCYITPHYGGSHPGYQERAGRIFLDNLRRYVAGEPLINVVDKREGY